MKTISRPQSAKEKFGATIKVNKNLDHLSKQVLFPEKLEKVNKLVSSLNLKH